MNAALDEAFLNIVQGGQREVGDSLVQQGHEGFGWREFRGVGKDEIRVEAGGYIEVVGGVPASIVEQQHDDLVVKGVDRSDKSLENSTHGGGVHMGHHPELATTCAGLDEAVNVKPLISSFLHGDGALTSLGPNFTGDGFEPDTPFIFGPDLNRFVGMFAAQPG